MKKLFVMFLVGATLIGGAVSPASANPIKYESIKTEIGQRGDNTNKDITYRWCKFICDCEDNCVENGFSFIMEDQFGERYIFDKDYDKEDLSETEYLVITKGDKKNVISAYQLTDKGLKNIYTLTPNGLTPYHIAH